MTRRIRDFFRLRRHLAESNRKLGEMLAESLRDHNRTLNALKASTETIARLTWERDYYRGLAELHAGARVTGEELPRA